MKIVLVEAPWGASLRPPLGLHALKAQLEGAILESRVEIRYSNIDFYDALPESFDKTILQSVFWSNPEVTWLAEAFFAPWSYPADEARSRLIEDFRERLKKIYENPGSERLIPPQFHTWIVEHLADALIALEDVVPAFLDDFAESATVAHADVLGFGHHFNQLFGSLAMAQAAKRVRPDLRVALGGASITKSLAQVARDRFPQIDYIFVGDAELGFLHLCEQLAKNSPPPCGTIETFTWKRSVAPQATLNFDAFLGRVEGTRFSSQLRSIAIEITRDCYWARISQCSFCGLPEQRNPRSADWRQVLANVIHLSDACRVRHFIFADPAIHHRKHGPFIEALADHFEGREEQPVFFFEARADTPPSLLGDLARLKNVIVQVGVESFGKGVLDLMNKGTSPIKNVEFLKRCKELGIFPYYNLLWGHPGEDPAEYESMAALIPRLLHLTPPSGYTPVLLCRDAPLFEKGSKYIGRVTPWLEYRYTFPDLSAEDLFKVSYYFDYEAVDNVGSPITSRPCLDRMVETWQSVGKFGKVHLVHYLEDGKLIVSDSRGVALGLGNERVFRFTDPVDAAIFDVLAEIKNIGVLTNELNARGAKLTETELTTKLTNFEAVGLVMREGEQGLLLSIPI